MFKYSRLSPIPDNSKVRLPLSVNYMHTYMYQMMSKQNKCIVQIQIFKSIYVEYTRVEIFAECILNQAIYRHIQI